jgi:adenylate cyclase
MLDQLRALPAEKSIVVVPFANLSPAQENEYLSDGFTDALIGDLAAIRRLEVAPRSSALSYKNTDKDPPTIARELRVRYVLEGSVRKAGTSLRITAQLIDGQGATQVWSDQYAGKFEEVFDLRERVSREVVHALEIPLSVEEDRIIAARPFADPMAYDCYLRALHELANSQDGAVERATMLARRGLEIAGDNPLLLACLQRADAERSRRNGGIRLVSE